MRIVILLLALTSATPAVAVPTMADWRAGKAVEIDFEAGRGRERLTIALDALLRTAARAMAERGHDDEAKELASGWMRMRPYSLGEVNGDVGDHDPLSVWLATAYDKIESVLGKWLCDFLHLSDIKTINFATPVVFHPSEKEKWCLDTLKSNPSDSCEREYARHFVGTKWQRQSDAAAKYKHDGLIPVIAYWTAWGSCEAATFGAGWTIICGPVGTGAEFATERWIAPGLSNRIYERANK